MLRKKTFFKNLMRRTRSSLKITLSLLSGLLLAGALSVYATSLGTNLFVTGTAGIASTSPWALLSVNPNGVSGPEFVVGSSTKSDFIVANDGNVGIGTTSPGTKLVIADSTIVSDAAFFRFLVGTGGQLYFERWGNGWNINLRTPGKNLYLNRDADSTSDLYLGRSSAGDAFTTVIKGATGNLGIGTTTPAHALDVLSSTDAQAIFEGTSNAGIEVRAQGAAGAIAYLDLATSSTNSIGAGTPDFGTRIAWNGSFNISTANTSNAFTITNAGNLGIGTTSPPTTLYIQSNTPSFHIDSTGSGNPQVGFKVNGVTKGYVWVCTASNCGTSDAIVKLNADGSTAGGVSINAANNVGVGTTSPWALLSVNPSGIAGPEFAIGSSTKTDLVVLNNGNVGVGTTSPSSIFSIEGPSTATTTLQLGNKQSTTKGSCIQLYTTSGAAVRLYATTTGTVAIWEAGACQ